MTEPSILVTQEYVDHSGERSTTRFFVPQASPPVIDATAKGHADSVHDAIAAVTLCNFVVERASILIDDQPRVEPAFDDAQREMAYLVSYVDIDNGGEYSFTIPGPLMALQRAGTDTLDLEDLTVAAAVAELESALCSPKAGDITITEIKFIGRNT